MNRRIMLGGTIATAGAMALPGWAAPKPVKFASARISVTVEGKGRDVILIPGMTSSPAAWAPTAAALPGHRYHFIQVKGFAGTPPEDNAAGPVSAPVAAEIARYIVAAKLLKPAIVGHSMGGTIGLMLAARQSELIGRLMVVDQIPFLGMMFGPPGTTARSVRPVADGMLAQMKAASPDSRDRQIISMLASMVRDETERKRVIADGLASNRDTVANAMHEMIVTDLGPELPRITAPVTILYVTPADVPYTDAQIDAAYRTAYAPLKGAKLIRIPDAAHFIMADNPARFLSELKGFLE